MKLRTVISIILAFIFALSLPVQTTAAGSSAKYVADVMVGMGESADEAKKALTDAGYTVLDQNVNEGAGSKVKTEKFVYLGYKTTDNPDEAVTDLAVMNMNGGYSFTDYAAMMDKYRDSKIKPFVDGFLATIKEYRENYNSENEANRVKAEYAYTVLSGIYNDDCKNNMAELLLNPTKEELGISDDYYNRFTDEKKKTTVDLTTALMQGNSQVVFLMERVLAAAADTNENTWLQRLSELGPDGLDAKYAAAGVRPTDAALETASLYNDTAKEILAGWETSRTALLDYEASVAGTENNSAAEGEVPDAGDLINIGVEDAEPKETNPLDPADMMDTINESLKSSLDIAEKVEDNRIAAIYALLKETPYGEGTMYDFFTKPYAEVSGDNISALYPMASTLTGGQVAAIEFLPLETLLQIGVTSGESYVECGPDNSDLLDLIKSAGQVSVFLNVNREIFGKTSAITSEALRKQTPANKGWTDPDSDLFGLSRLTALTWAATGVTLAVAVFSAVNATAFGKYMSKVADFGDALEEAASNYKVVMANAVKFTDNAGNIVDMTERINLYSTFNVTRTGSNTVKATFGFDLEAVKEGFNFTPEASRQLQDFSDAATQTVTLESGAAKHLSTSADSAEEFLNDVRANEEIFYKDNSSWMSVANAATFVVVLITVISIFMTVADLYQYYNVNYTPIPKYIVDEADITELDADGNRTFVRNDTAYYAVAPTNRPKTHEQFEALQDYSDLNGDAGKEWLALYSVKQPGGEPILADSFRAVTGTTSMPDGYAKGIHAFGSTAAANLTDSRFTYNDGLGGLYIYYKTEAPAATAAASTFSGGTFAVIGVSGLAVGAVLGVVITTLIKRKKSAAAE